jgi:hypothetical protein
VGNQKDFDPNADGIMVHAGCYLIINSKEGYSIHASFFGGAARYLQHGAIVRGFKDIQGEGEAPARVRAARMVAELPEATTSPFIPQGGVLQRLRRHGRCRTGIGSHGARIYGV